MNDGVWKLVRLLATLAMLIGVGTISWLHEWMQQVVAAKASTLAEIALLLFGVLVYFISEMCE